MCTLDLAIFKFQAFECCLTNVRPSYQLSPAGKWSPESTERFRELVANKILIMNVRLFSQ